MLSKSGGAAAAGAYAGGRLPGAAWTIGGWPNTAAGSGLASGAGGAGGAAGGSGSAAVTTAGGAAKGCGSAACGAASALLHPSTSHLPMLSNVAGLSFSVSMIICMRVPVIRLTVWSTIRELDGGVKLNAPRLPGAAGGRGESAMGRGCAQFMPREPHGFGKNRHARPYPQGPQRPGRRHGSPAGTHQPAVPGAQPGGRTPRAHMPG